MTASSTEINNMQIKGDNTFHRARGGNRSRSFGRGNDRGYGRGVVDKSENASGKATNSTFVK